ncbi:MAG: hypothetical protein K1W30_11775 [Lachnospiraceae bacterium]
MEELYLVMRDFLEVEYNQESLLCLLKAVESAYTTDQQEDTQLIANSTKYYVQTLQKELKAAIGRLDSYIAKNV